MKLFITRKQQSEHLLIALIFLLPPVPTPGNTLEWVKDSGGFQQTWAGPRFFSFQVPLLLTWIPGLFNQQKLITGQRRNLGKVSGGTRAVAQGIKTSNSFPCSLLYWGAIWSLKWGGSKCQPSSQATGVAWVVG